MTLEALDMPRDLAVQKLREYRDANRRSSGGHVFHREDRMIEKALRAAARGRRIIDANAVILAAGLFPNGLPKLAICRAHRAHVFYERPYSNNPPVFREHEWDVRRGWPKIAIVGADTWPVTARRYKAAVPMIPPRIRPARLQNYHILWEADWHAMPVDPYLLKRVDGSIFVVVAQWDLTPIERAAMAAVRRPSET